MAKTIMNKTQNKKRLQKKKRGALHFAALPIFATPPATDIAGAYPSAFASFVPIEILLMSISFFVALLLISKIQLKVKKVLSYLYKHIIRRHQHNYSYVMKELTRMRQQQERQASIMQNISHQMQTPLTILRGELDLLHKNVKNKDVLERCDRTIKRISSFVTELLGSAKTEFNKCANHNMQRVDLGGIISHRLDTFFVLAEEKHISIEKKISKNIIISGEPDRIEELISNIISNSIKYISNDRKIIVSLKRSGKMAVIKVKDTGVGIHSADIPNLGRRFFRAKQDEEHFDGTGLGLAICKHIVTCHNGTMSINSELSRGTTVTIGLPLYVETPAIPVQAV
jgi:signal transduction histidine kinase